MNNKKKQVTKLGNLGKFLGFSSPLTTSRAEVVSFEKEFGYLLETLLENDDLSSSHLIIPISELTAKEYVNVLLKEWDSSSPFIKLVCYLICLNRYGKDERAFPFDAKEFIENLILMTDIMRRKDTIAAFGSKSKNQEDKVLKPSRLIKKTLDQISDELGEDKLPAALHLQFEVANSSFLQLHSNLEKYSARNRSDTERFERIYSDLQRQAGGNKGFVTEAINAFIKDLQVLEISIGSQYGDKSWTKKISDRKKKRKKSKKNKQRKT